MSDDTRLSVLTDAFVLIFKSFYNVISLMSIPYEYICMLLYFCSHVICYVPMLYIRLFCANKNFLLITVYVTL